MQRVGFFGRKYQWFEDQKERGGFRSYGVGRVLFVVMLFGFFFFYKFQIRFFLLYRRGVFFLIVLFNCYFYYVYGRNFGGLIFFLFILKCFVFQDGIAVQFSFFGDNQSLCNVFVQFVLLQFCIRGGNFFLVYILQIRKLRNRRFFMMVWGRVACRVKFFGLFQVFVFRKVCIFFSRFCKGK